jgi:tetratricopeptide (TPR) repeat protein
MPNRRFARRTHREAARLAAAGDHPAAQAAFAAAAAEYRDRLAAHPGDRGSREDFAELLAAAAQSHAATGDYARAYAAERERDRVAEQLGTAGVLRARQRLDLAEAAVRAGRLLTGAVQADAALNALDDTDPGDPGAPGFADMAAALARAARVFGRAADPDLAAGAADQAARMLLAAGRQDVLLRDSLRLAAALHAASGRAAHARGARDLLGKYFPEAEPLTAPTLLTLRGALQTATGMGAFGDATLIGRLCPDPAGRDAPPTVAARCDLGLAAVALHAAEPAVDALVRSNPGIAWRIATEVHYLLSAAERNGERNLHVNFRDHGPVWVRMLMALTEDGKRGPLMADLAGILAGLCDRLHTRHAAPEHEPLMRAAAVFIDAHRDR